MFRAEDDRIGTPGPCEDCTEEGVGGWCPYSEEIHDTRVFAYLCATCYQNRCDDI